MYKYGVWMVRHKQSQPPEKNIFSKVCAHPDVPGFHSNSSSEGRTSIAYKTYMLPLNQAVSTLGHKVDIVMSRFLLRSPLINAFLRDVLELLKDFVQDPGHWPRNPWSPPLNFSLSSPSKKGVTHCEVIVLKAILGLDLLLGVGAQDCLGFRATQRSSPRSATVGC